MAALHFAQITDRGLVRTQNEDALWSSPWDAKLFLKKGALFVIADGLGGLPKGEVASRMAVETVAEAYESFWERPESGWLHRAFLKANAAICGQNARSPRNQAMATTLTASWFFGDRFTVAHVGDCRLYRVRGGEALPLTRDHAEGRHALTRAVGLEDNLEVDVFTEDFIKSDVYLQASDGLYPLLTPKEIAETAQSLEPDAACRRFVELAKSRGGPDNVTVQVIRVV